MGCNYYATQRCTEEMKVNIKAHVDMEAWNEVIELIPKRIHLGKSSNGWVFIFDHNNWDYFGKTRESVELFLKGCDIEDECKFAITIDDFWNLVELKKHEKTDLYIECHNGLYFHESTEFC